MLRGSKSGGCEIGELTSISSPGQLADWLRLVRPVSQSQCTHTALSPVVPLLALPPLHLGLAGPLPPEERAPHQGLGGRLSMLNDACIVARGKAQCIPNAAVYCVVAASQHEAAKASNIG